MDCIILDRGLLLARGPDGRLDFPADFPSMESVRSRVFLAYIAMAFASGMATGVIDFDAKASGLFDP